MTAIDTSHPDFWSSPDAEPQAEPQSSKLKKAVAFAILLHLVLALVIPDLPTFQFATIIKNSGLNVFIEPGEEEFEKSLNRPLPVSSDEQSLIEQELGATSASRGEQSEVSEESIEVRSKFAGHNEEAPAGKDPQARVRPRILTSWSAIRSFTDQLASTYADINPHEVERFGRSFNSFRSYRSRNQTVGYRDQYGDFYVRDQSSAGDICFKQERELVPDELATRTVYFFRCGEKPLKLDISKKPLG